MFLELPNKISPASYQPNKNEKLKKNERNEIAEMEEASLDWRLKAVEERFKLGRRKTDT